MRGTWGWGSGRGLYPKGYLRLSGPRVGVRLRVEVVGVPKAETASWLKKNFSLLKTASLFFYFF